MYRQAAPKSQSKSAVLASSADSVYWISCVAQKRTNPAPAKDLYMSAWFTKARAYVESIGAPWFILSAKYGLVAPAQIIQPYELTLNNLPIADRRRWADTVLAQVSTGPLPSRIVFLAGARYREFLEPRLKAMGVAVDVPMEGLRIGEQLSWLGEKARGG